MMTKTYKGRRATVEIAIQNGDETYHYSVWDPRKGFIAGGWRHTEQDAKKVAEVVLKSK